MKQPRRVTRRVVVEFVDEDHIGSDALDDFRDLMDVADGRRCARGIIQLRDQRARGGAEEGRVIRGETHLLRRGFRAGETAGEKHR